MLTRDVMSGGRAAVVLVVVRAPNAPFILAADVFASYACGILFMFARSVYYFISVIQRAPRNAVGQLLWRFSREFADPDSG